MFTSGEFARLGRVSVRMLRHYDALGLLQPAQVDLWTSYRRYELDQLNRLNRLLALKDLGFSLEQVRDILDATFDSGQLRGMLILRRAELADRLSADADRLARVEARLRLIEREGSMNSMDVTTGSTPPTTVAAISGSAPSVDEVGPVVNNLFGQLMTTVGRENLTVTGPAIATYEPGTEPGSLVIHAGITVPPDSHPRQVELLTLPAQKSVASLLYRGPMSGIAEAYQTLGVWIEENGYHTDGTAREVYLKTMPAPEEEWETEVCMPIATQRPVTNP